MKAHDSPLELVILIASATTVISLSSLVVRFDERRLSEVRLERAWPPVARDNAIIGLGMLFTPLLSIAAVWFHFFRTRSSAMWPPWRWSLRGWLLGLACAALIMAVNIVVVLALAAAAGLDVG